MMTRAEQLEQDRQLVISLWQCDSDAWEMVYRQAILPVTRQGIFRDMLRDWQITPLDVFGMVYESMLVEKKLAKYKNDGSFIGWLNKYTRGSIRKFCEKNPRAVSKRDDKTPNIGGGGNNRPPWKDLKFAQKCFGQLWRKNPMRAYVHLLWVKSGLKPQEIMKILGMSSVDNVYKMHERAEKDMQAIRDAYMKDIIE